MSTYRRQGLACSSTRARALSFELLESRRYLSADGGLLFSFSSHPFLDPRAFESGLSDNLPITTAPGKQQAPSLAVDPRDASHLVLVYSDYAQRTTGLDAGLGVAVSADGGETWQHGSIPLPDGFDRGASEPIVRFDSDGRVYASFRAGPFQIPGPDFRANNGIFVARSDDGGRSWLPAIAVTSHAFGDATLVPWEIFPDLAIDTIRTLPDGHPNPNHGNLYVTWTRFYPPGQFPGEKNSVGGSDVMLAVSQDHGETWQLRTRPRSVALVPETVLQTPTNTGMDQVSGYMNWPRVAVGADGDVSVADYAGGWFFVNHSVNAGASFLVPDRNDPKLVGLPFGRGPKLLIEGLTKSGLETEPVRAIAADPTRPGHLYVAEPLPIIDDLGRPLDGADIFFARSDNYGETWQTTILHGGNPASVVNDDHDGRPATGGLDDVVADQLLVRLQVSDEGDIGLVWYDSRRDPSHQRLDVFGAISSDGGRSFSPNFRVTDQSFDPAQGSFTKDGEPFPYLGYGMGLALTRESVYVAWTDTRAGNQDIFFRRVPRTPLPAPPNDRFEPNDDAGSATVIGQVVSRSFPRLALEDGDSDWFQLQSLATGTLSVKVNVVDAAPLNLQIRDASGHTVLAQGVAHRDAAGKVTGWHADTSATADKIYLVRVTADVPVSRFSMDVQALTAELGPLVYREISGTLGPGDQAYYLLESAAAGSLSAELDGTTSDGATFEIEFLDADEFTSILASAKGENPRLEVPVRLGDKLLLRVMLANGSRGSFHLQLANRDQLSATVGSVQQFPAGRGPSQLAVSDFNRDGFSDVAVTNTGLNTVSVALGNRDGTGTFSAPRSFAIGAFRTPNPVGDDAHLGTYRRDILAADFNGDAFPDLAITNFDSSDVSILLWDAAEGAFQPQRRFDTIANPFGLATDDVNGDGNFDLVVIDTPDAGAKSHQLSVLLGRGDGTFLPQRITRLPARIALFLSTVALGDLNQDGATDLVLGGGISDGVEVFRGTGDGAFYPVGRFAGSRQAASLAIADVNGDGNLDVVATSLSDDNSVWVLPGDGKLRLGAPQRYGRPTGQGPLAVKVADWGSQIELPDGSYALGPPDERPDLIVANSGVIPGRMKPVGAPGIVVLPGLADETGRAAGFGVPLSLATAQQPLDVELGDFDGDGQQDLSFLDRNGFSVILGGSPAVVRNVTRDSARDLGPVMHLVQPTLTILPGQQESWFRLQVPREVSTSSRDQVIDFSGGFTQVTGAGLGMEVVDEQGNRRGMGERFRITASQGETLFVHVFGARNVAGERTAGAYTLVIDTLPQLVAVEAPVLLPGANGRPGGPTSGLVLEFQGDRLDPGTAQNPANYRVTWMGPDGQAGTGDDRIYVAGAGLRATDPVVYSPSGNRDVASGRTYPAAVRQTVTLTFSEPLPAGSYLIEVSPQVQAAPWNEYEWNLLSSSAGFSNHSVVSLVAGQVREGARWTARDLVRTEGAVSDLREFETGTRFLTQLHADLGALLDAALSQRGDDDETLIDPQTDTSRLLEQVVARLSPALGAVGERAISLLVLVLDPVSISLVDPQGKTFRYDLQTNVVGNAISRTYVQVGGNVEVVVIPRPRGTFELNVADVPPRARGGLVYFGKQGQESQKVTGELRGSVRSYDFLNRGIAVRPLTGDLRGSVQSFRFHFESPSAVSSVTSASSPNAMLPLSALSSTSVMLPLSPRLSSVVATPTRASSGTNSNRPATAQGFVNPRLATANASLAARMLTRDHVAAWWSQAWDRFHRYWNRLRPSVRQAARSLLQVVLPSFRADAIPSQLWKNAAVTAAKMFTTEPHRAQGEVPGNANRADSGGDTGARNSPEFGSRTPREEGSPETSGEMQPTTTTPSANPPGVATGSPSRHGNTTRAHRPDAVEIPDIPARQPAGASDPSSRGIPPVQNLSTKQRSFTITPARPKVANEYTPRRTPEVGAMASLSENAGADEHRIALSGKD